MQNKIPFNKPFMAGKELFYIAQSIVEGHCSGDGAFTRKCQQLIESKFNIKKALLTTSCTSALEMSAILLDLQPGDEVILPSYTFVSTVNAYVLRGAVPVFVDIDESLNMDVNHVASAMTDRTRAIVPVHYAGNSCDMDKLMEVANGIPVVEDAAQAINAKYKDRYLGSIGSLATFSFHETKNVICGEGGALLINDPEYIERAEIIREKGTNRSKFFRGEVDKYTWVDIGSSYLSSDILAAFLYSQLEHIGPITDRRRQIFERYQRNLTDLAGNGARLPVVPDYNEANYHMFYLLVENGLRDDLIQYLRDRKVHSVFHYMPLHLSPMGRAYGYAEGDLPNTENFSAQLVRLPFYYELADEEVDKICEYIHEFFRGV